MREASASEALNGIGDEPVARILASLREEHDHLEGKPWMGEQRRIVGLTIAALGWHLKAQGVGHTIPNPRQVDELIEVHVG